MVGNTQTVKNISEQSDNIISDDIDQNAQESHQAQRQIINNIGETTKKDNKTKRVIETIPNKRKVNVKA